MPQIRAQQIDMHGRRYAQASLKHDLVCIETQGTGPHPPAPTTAAKQPSGGRMLSQKRTQPKNQRHVSGFSGKADVLMFEIKGTLQKSDHQSRTEEGSTSSAHSSEAAAAGFKQTENPTDSKMQKSFALLRRF